ncbi:DUF4129 domain-containing protein [Adhaeretor mobilis]|uniref:Protein-glutamine gamma-glutamyltransferase-like C-terminal domain-containing protein n=1 Tax=Adhaeretor mobilis TaxID=1930276 RepID=A0A517MQR4_9BACT|nr:DUF4129 domain-containing protein [Adhaeretor mobilis]QDS97226.1 hypothetical protein HG15A2_04870 [Adhaeretor mobilis]
MSAPLTPPDPERIRRTAAEILSGPEFQTEPDSRAGDTIVDIMLQLLEWVVAPFHWIFDAMEGLPESLRWLIVIGLFILLVFLIGHIIYSLTSALRPTTRNSKFISALSSNRKRTAEEFEQLAQEAVAQHDYISSVRFLFRASLVHLHAVEGRVLSPGLTNRQYLRRYSQSRFVDSLRAFVETIDVSWYGNGVCREEEYLKCRDAYAEIRLQTKAGTHADSA